MNFIPSVFIIFTLILTFVHKDLAINTMPELKKTAYDILENEIGLILPTFDKRWKRFLPTVLGSIASSVIGLAFE